MGDREQEERGYQSGIRSEENGAGQGDGEGGDAAACGEGEGMGEESEADGVVDGGLSVEDGGAAAVA